MAWSTMALLEQVKAALGTTNPKDMERLSLICAYHACKLAVLDLLQHLALSLHGVALHGDVWCPQKTSQLRQGERQLGQFRQSRLL